MQANAADPQGAASLAGARGEPLAEAGRGRGEPRRRRHRRRGEDRRPRVRREHRRRRPDPRRQPRRQRRPDQEAAADPRADRAVLPVPEDAGRRRPAGTDARWWAERPARLRPRRHSAAGRVRVRAAAAASSTCSAVCSAAAGAQDSSVRPAARPPRRPRDVRDAASPEATRISASAGSGVRVRAEVHHAAEARFAVEGQHARRVRRRPRSACRRRGPGGDGARPAPPGSGSGGWPGRRPAPRRSGRAQPSGCGSHGGLSAEPKPYGASVPDHGIGTRHPSRPRTT